MSHDLRRSNGPTQPQAAPRPQFGRPSLFAGAEDGDAQEGDTQRVRLLSTLESTRRPLRQPPSRQQRVRQQRQAWQRKALIGLMGAGVLALLGSFALVVREGHAPNAEAKVQNAATAQARAPSSTTPSPAPTQANPLATLAALAPASGPAATPPQAQPSAPQTATIETPAALPVPVGPMVAASVPAQRPAHSEASRSANANANANGAGSPQAKLATPKEVTPTAGKASAPKATTTATTGVSARDEVTEAVTKAQTPPKAGKARPQDDDVALLEAMFAHAGQRRQGLGAPAAGEHSIDEQLRRCKALAGADAATCRAKACVQHPKAEACHRD